MQSKAKHRILQNTAILFAGQLVTWSLSIVFTVYVPRRVGNVGWGELSLATAFTSLASMLVGLGMGTLMVRDIAQDRSKAADMIGAALLVELVLLLPTLFLMALIAWLAGYSLETQSVIFIAAIGMVVRLMVGPIQASFQALERMQYFSLSTALDEGILTAASVSIVLAGGGVIWLSIASTATAFIILTLNLIWWRPFGGIRLRVNFRLARYLVVGSLPFWATGIFLTIYLYIDSLMLSFLTNVGVVGWYNVPTRLFGMLLFIPTILSAAMFPALSRTFKQAPAEMVSMAQRSFNMLTCLSLPIAVGGMLLAKRIILLFYGQDFAPSIPVMIVLAATLVPTYLNILVNQFLLAAGRQIAWTRVMAAACVLNPALNWVLIQHYQQTQGNGAFGAALALLITEVLMTVAGIVLLPRGLLGWHNVVSMVKSCSACGLMALAIWYTRDYFLALPIAAGAVTYLGAALALGALPREDLVIGGEIAGKVLRKLGIKRPSQQTRANVV